MTAAPDSPPPTRWLALALNLFGLVVVAYALLASYTERLGPVLLTVGLIGLAAWLAVVVVSARDSSRVPAAQPAAWLPAALTAVMAVCGALIAAPTLGLGIALTVAALLRAVGNPRWPLWWGAALTLASLGLVAVGAIVITSAAAPGGELSALGLLSIEGGVVIAALGGLSRRQLRIAEAQAEALREERHDAREKQVALDALAARQSVARDMHDVLAHSLGGLVIQLDAVDALLEAGQTQAAETRVRAARTLAVQGLADARRAVDALRAPREEPPVPLDRLLADVRDLVAADRVLGAQVNVEQSSDLAHLSAEIDGNAPDATIGAAHRCTDLSEPAATAIRRAVQESLTNARKHSPAAPVSVQLSVEQPPDGPAALRVRITNRLATLDTAPDPSVDAAHDARPDPSGDAAHDATPDPSVEATPGTGPGPSGDASHATAHQTVHLPAYQVADPAVLPTAPDTALATSGAGHGLTGMRERFAAVPGATLRAGVVGDRFEVDARVPVGAASTSSAKLNP